MSLIPFSYKVEEVVEEEVTVFVDGIPIYSDNELQLFGFASKEN